MSLNNKKLLINNLKIKLDNLIKISLNEIPNNIKNIKVMIDNHYFFINFIETINIYIEDKYKDIKILYNKLKIKINQDKKLYFKIIKIYGIVNCYYSIEEFNNYNNIINELYEYNNDMKIEWDKIKILHNLLINKRKNYIKNQNIIKVFIMNDDINQIINNLYKNYDRIKNNLVN